MSVQSRGVSQKWPNTDQYHTEPESRRRGRPFGGGECMPRPSLGTKQPYGGREGGREGGRGGGAHLEKLLAQDFDGSVRKMGAQLVGAIEKGFPKVATR